MTGFDFDKRYREIVAGLAMMHKTYTDLEALAEETGDYDHEMMAKRAYESYEERSKTVADVLGVHKGFIHEDVLKAV